MKSHLTLAIALIFLAAIVGGCADEAPPGPSLGGTSISKYVAVGNSLTAGYQSNGLYRSAQEYSFPNLVQKQLRDAGANLGDFVQPLWSDPGSPSSTNPSIAGRYELLVLDPVSPVIGPRGVAPGSPINLALNRPYDNLGLPGAPLAGFLDTVGTYHGGLGPYIIRTNPPVSQPFPKSPYLQAVALNPDLVTFWLGANDVLGYATTGGASPSIPAPTPSATFTLLYTNSLGALRASLPNAKIIVANVPSVTAVPFFTTIGPKVKAALASTVFAAGGDFYYQKAGESGAATGTTKFDEAAGSRPLLTLPGGAYATLIGTPTFEPFRSLFAPFGGYPAAAAAGLDSTKPFGLHPQNPWPNAYVLDATEQTNVSNAITAFNSTIATVAAANNAEVFDAYAFFNDVAANGYLWAGTVFTADYVTGGLFSLDGVHPSSRGNGVIANQFIKVMNQKFGMSVQPVNISSIPGLDAPTSKTGSEGYPSVSPEILKSFETLFAPSTIR